jgi:deoxyribodipyrimidine photo-lyase
MRTLVWFRGKDLRIADHAPLVDAAKAGEVIPVFVIDPHFFAPERAAGMPHRMQFLLQSIAGLRKNLSYLGSELVLARGKSVEVIPRLAEQWRVDRVSAHRWVEPFARERDARVTRALSVPFAQYEGVTLAPPGSLRTRAGTPFAVFTHFAKAFAREVTPGLARPLPAPKSLPALPSGVASAVELPTLAALGLTPNPRLPEGGERAARERLARFVRGPAGRYHELRDRMDVEGTSRLSTDLKFGALSVRTVWTRSGELVGRDEARQAFSNELLWREFAHHTLWDRPEVLEHPFRTEFEGFPWQDDEAGWDAWTTGHTGYPVVDAAARQLLAEGFVHNRARMIAASFLTKHLLIDYRRGEAHYLRYLTDGDWAPNNLGWQWSAGCGCDAQPYFRVFNPVTQGTRLDPTGGYVRRWVPELGALPTKWLAAPWTAPSEVLRAAGVRLGDNYPLPIVDHAFARARFLALAKQHLTREPACLGAGGM